MFTLESTDGDARAGVLQIGKKKITTPFFMPVGTKAALKALTPDQLAETGTQCIISNGFILSLKPGTSVLRSAGGIHKFMHWNGGVFTDSGGFQVLLDEFFVKRDPKGIVFKNPFTGERSVFGVSDSLQIQNDIGSDVAMAFDDVSRYGYTKKQSRDAMERSLDWAKESLEYHRKNTDKTNPDQLIFGIVHGNVYADLRKESALAMRELDFDGFAIGGVAIGESTAELYEAISIQAPLLPKGKPRYIMGLGSPIDILEAIGMGADCFDSIFPSQNARRATLFTRDGPLRITNKEQRDKLEPVDSECSCYACKNYTRAYMSLVLKTHEYVGYTLATIHNLTFIQDMIRDARTAIVEGRFAEFKEAFKKRYGEETREGGSYFHYTKEEKTR